MYDFIHDFGVIAEICGESNCKWNLREMGEPSKPNKKPFEFDYFP